MNYQDFVLEMRTLSLLRVEASVLHSPGGEAASLVTLPTWVMDPDSLHEEYNRVGPQELGSQLFNALFTGEIRVLYDVSRTMVQANGEGLRLRLRVDSPLVGDIPWEYMFDTRNGEYVCLSRGTPIVRHYTLPQPIRPLTVRPPLRMLGMVATPSDLDPLDSEAERSRVELALSGLRDKGLVEVIWLAGQTWRDLQRAMRQGPWHLFHFIGHGAFDRSMNEGYLALCDENQGTRLVSGADLARLLDDPSLRLVILNSCEGALGAPSNPFSSIAATLTRRNLPAVIAMRSSITDYGSIEFARSLYEAIADGEPVDAAVTEARKAMSLVSPNNLDWAIPVLHMRSSNGQIFDIGNVITAAPETRTGEPSSVVRTTPVPTKLAAPDQVTVSAGESVFFPVSVSTASGDEILSTLITGTIEGPIGSLSGYLFTAAIRTGAGRIVWRIGDLTAVTTVNVVPATLAALTLVPSQATINVGKNIQFKAYGTDIFGNEFDTKPLWRTTMGFIGEDGTFAALAHGIATVTAETEHLSCEAKLVIERHRSSEELLVKVGILMAITPSLGRIMDPYPTLNRAEAVTLVVRLLGRRDDAMLLRGMQSYIDMVNHWASGEIALAKGLGILDGLVHESSFSPNAKLDGESAVMLVRNAFRFSGGDPLKLRTLDIERCHQVTRTQFFDLLVECAFDNILPNGKTLAQTYLKTSAPTISLQSSSMDAGNKVALIRGEASSDTEILAVAGRPVPLNNGRFECAVPLLNGVNTIAVVATDIAGNSTTEVISLLRR